MTIQTIVDLMCACSGDHNGVVDAANIAARALRERDQEIERLKRREVQLLRLFGHPEHDEARKLLVDLAMLREDA